MIVNGYLYHHLKTQKDTTIWRCKNRFTCKSYVKTNNIDLRIVSVPNSHNHEATDISKDKTFHFVDNDARWDTYESNYNKTRLRVNNFTYYKI